MTRTPAPRIASAVLLFHAEETASPGPSSRTRASVPARASRSGRDDCPDETAAVVGHLRAEHLVDPAEQLTGRIAE